MPRRTSRRVDRFAQFAVAVALQAVEEAKLDLAGTTALSRRTGVLLGSGYGPSSLLQESALALRDRGYKGVGPYASAASAIDSAPGEVALRLGIHGPSGALSTACASGTSAVGEAVRSIRHGYTDVMIAGGSDDAVCPVDIASACVSRALSRRNDEPTRASRPFDRDRDGFVMAAGAGALVLEEAEHAERRGADVLAEVVGYGATSDAHHPTAPHPEGAGAREAMRLALADAGIGPDAVDHINAHGTSTALNDRTESESIRADVRRARIPDTGERCQVDDRAHDRRRWRRRADRHRGGAAHGRGPADHQLRRPGGRRAQLRAAPPAGARHDVRDEQLLRLRRPQRGPSSSAPGPDPSAPQDAAC